MTQDAEFDVRTYVVVFVTEQTLIVRECSTKRSETHTKPAFINEFRAAAFVVCTSIPVRECGIA